MDASTSSTNRATALLDVFRQGLQVSGDQQAQAMLGDRSTYLGISDIARYADCPRAAIANKLQAQTDTLNRLLTLQRGHWFEAGVGECLAAINRNTLAQLEIQYTWQRAPIRSHLDFTLVWNTPMPAVRVVEVKSMEALPVSPYNAHAVQIQGQVDLLHALWNEPVFSLRNTTGQIQYSNLTFPELCKKHCGVQLPASPQKVSLEGWLLCLSMKDARAFGPYKYDKDSLSALLTMADDYWTALQAVAHNKMALSDVSHASGFHLLCANCDWNADCPKFSCGEDQPQWDAALAKLEKLKARRTDIDTEIKEMETALKQAHTLSGVKGWINTGNYRFRTTTTAGRRTLDKDGLCEELVGLCESINIPALFQKHEHEGSSYTRLSITPIN